MSMSEKFVPTPSISSSSITSAKEKTPLLPTKWSAPKGQPPAKGVKLDNAIATFGHASTQTILTTDNPIILTDDIYYFEITILKDTFQKGANFFFGISLVLPNTSLTSSDMLCYTSSNGNFQILFKGNSSDALNRIYGATYRKGDIIGCGISKEGVFFTKNGEVYPEFPWSSMASAEIWPIIIKQPQKQKSEQIIKGIFPGSEELSFDIEEFKLKKADLPTVLALEAQSLKWSTAMFNKSVFLKVTEEKRIEHIGKLENVIASITTAKEIELKNGMFYYETRVEKIGKKPIGIGIRHSSSEGILSALPGQLYLSWGYRSDGTYVTNGYKIQETLITRKSSLGPYSNGDTVGVGIIEQGGCLALFFTLNGQLSEKVVWRDLPSALFPFIGLTEQGDTVVTNFVKEDEWKFDPSTLTEEVSPIPKAINTSTFISNITLSQNAEYMATYSELDSLIAVWTTNPFAMIKIFKAYESKPGKAKYVLFITISNDGRFVACSQNFNIIKDNGHSSRPWPVTVFDTGIDANNRPLAQADDMKPSLTNTDIWWNTDIDGAPLYLAANTDGVQPLIIVTESKLYTLNPLKREILHTFDATPLGISLSRKVKPTSIPKVRGEGWTYDTLERGLISVNYDNDSSSKLPSDFLNNTDWQKLRRKTWRIWDVEAGESIGWITGDLDNDFTSVEISPSRDLYAAFKNIRTRNNKEYRLDSVLHIFYYRTGIPLGLIDLKDVRVLLVRFDPLNESRLILLGMRSDTAESTFYIATIDTFTCTILEEHNIPYLGIRKVGSDPQYMRVFLIPTRNSVTVFEGWKENLSIHSYLGPKVYHPITLIPSNPDEDFSFWRMSTARSTKQSCKETWLSVANAPIAIYAVDDQRTVAIGRSSIQIRFSAPYPNYIYGGAFRLQYIWTIPIEEYDADISISKAILFSDERGVYFVDLEYNAKNYMVQLPRKEDELTIPIMQSALVTIFFIRRLSSDNVAFRENRIVKELRAEFIQKAIEKYPQVFTKIGPNLYPIREMLLVDEWEYLILRIIGASKSSAEKARSKFFRGLVTFNDPIPSYIPVYHRGIDGVDGHQSALSMAISSRKFQIISALLDYYIDRTIHENVGFMNTVVDVLPELTSSYPDLVSSMMKAISYCRCDAGLLAHNKFRSSKKNLYGFSVMSELPSISYSPPSKKFSLFWKRDSQPKLNNRKANDTREEDEIPLEEVTVLDIPDTNSDLVTNVNDDNNDDDNENSEAKSTKRRGSNKDSYSFNKFVHQKSFSKMVDDTKSVLTKPVMTKPALVYIVPLPGFCIYKEHEDNDKWSWYDRFRWTYIAPRSPFSRLALSPNANRVFGTPCMEAVLKFKWHKFARKRYYWMMAIQITFMFIFIAAVSGEPVENLEATLWRKICLLLTMPIAIMGLLYEAIQWLGEGTDYWDPYNIFDIASNALPLTISIRVWQGLDLSAVLVAISIIIMWIHFLLMFRVFQEIGVFISVVIEILGKLVWFLLVLGIILIGFANTFYVLLGFPVDGSSNSFSNPLQAFKYVFFLLTGDTNAFEPFDNTQPTIDILRIIFLITTTIILLNILIALLNEIYSQSKVVGRESWLFYRAKTIAEMEIYMMTPSQRKSKDLFPDFIYYEGNPIEAELYSQSSQVTSDSQTMQNLVEKVGNDILEKVQEQQRLMLAKLEQMTGQMPEDQKPSVVNNSQLGTDTNEREADEMDT